MWDSRSGQLLHELRGHQDTVGEASFSNDGDRIVTASSDNTARVWDSRSGQLLHELRGHQDTVGEAGFSNDGDRIVTASSDNTARVWDSRSGQLLHELRGHQASVDGIEFSSNGDRILTRSSDSTVRIWDSESGQLLNELIGHQTRVHSAGFNDASDLVLTAGFEKNARVWDVYNLDGLLAYGCDYLTPYFTNHPEDLADLTTCHTPARKLSAAPAYVRQGDVLAAQGDVKEAIERYQAALEWGFEPRFEPEQRVREMGDGG